MLNNASAPISSIYDKIYSNVATQSVEVISGGGNTRPTSYMARLMDHVQNDAKKTKISNKLNKRIVGGDSNSNEYDSPFSYIHQNEGALTMNWIAITGLSRICTYPPRSAIIVIPPKAEMESQIKEIESALKAAGLKKGTSEGMNFIITHNFSFKNNCLNVYGKSSPDNNSFDYDVKIGSSSIIRRTAMSSAVFYMQCNSEDDIIVGVDSKLSSPSKLKLLAKCKNLVYVFGGKMPSDPIETSPNPNSKVLNGGATEIPSIDSYRNYFERLIKYRNNNISDAAYDFIGALGCAGIPAKDLANHYSSNYTHAAFENMFSLENILRKKLGGDKGCDGPYCVLKSIYDNSKIDDVHESIQKIYKPRKNRISIKRAQNALKDIFIDAQHNVNNGAEANNKFISNMEQLYSKIDNVQCFRADLATSAVQNRSGAQAFHDACNLVDTLSACKNVDSVFNSETISGGGKDSERTVRTALMNTVFDKLYSAPFIGIICKENVPLPVGFEYVKKARKTKDTNISLLNLLEDDDSVESVVEYDESSDFDSESVEGGKKRKKREKKCKKCKKPMSKCVCGGGNESSDESSGGGEKCPVCGKKGGKCTCMNGGGEKGTPKDVCEKCGGVGSDCKCGGTCNKKTKTTDEYISLFA